MRFRIELLPLLVLLTAVTVAWAEPELRPLFNGKDLSGWDAEPGLWRVKDGVIEGGHPDAGPIDHSSWLILRDGEKDAVVRDFHFRTEFRMGEFNSGVQYRSTRLHAKRFEVGGYQMDLLNGLGTGGLYQQNHSGTNVDVGASVVNEKGGKGTVTGEVADRRWLFARKYYEKGEWSRIDVVCRGNHSTHFVNGYPVVEYIDRDDATPDRKRRNDDGVIALQLHGGKGTEMRVSFRDLYLRAFPDRYGDAQRLFNDADLAGWKAPADEAWTAKPAEKDKNGRVRAFGRLACAGNGKQPLLLATEHGPAFLFRCQVKTDAWKPGEKAPFKAVDGWNLLEMTFRSGAATVEYNGELRADIPPLVAGGQVALPGNVAAEYRNLVLIPILPGK